MCEHLHENNGKCCGECSKPKICDCGAIFPEGEKIIRCTSCLDIICSQCGHKDWNETGLPACILDDCKAEVVEKYISNLITKLDAAEKQNNEDMQLISILETRLEVTLEARGNNIAFLCKRAKEAEKRREAAAEALRQIECITNELKDVYLDEAWPKIHTIAQNAYRAAK